MKKFKFLSIILILMLALSMGACGKKFVTYEDYDTLVNTEGWSEMTIEEVNKVVGMDGTLDEESTENWGEGYEVYDWPSEDGGVGLTVLMKDKEGDGKLTPASASTSLSAEDDGDEDDDEEEE